MNRTEQKRTKQTNKIKTDKIYVEFHRDNMSQMFAKGMDSFMYMKNKLMIKRIYI